MADTDGAGQPQQPDDKPPESNAPDHTKALSDLETRFSKLEGTATGYQKEIESLKRENLLLSNQVSASRQPVSDQIAKIQEEIDKSYQEGRYGDGFKQQALLYLEKPITDAYNRLEGRLDRTMELLAKSQRHAISRMDGVSKEDMLAIDAGMSKLTAEERAEPGAWQHALDSLRDEEELAERRLTSAGDQSKVTTRGKSEPDDDGETQLTKEEAEMSERFGMSQKEWKEWSNKKTMDI